MCYKKILKKPGHTNVPRRPCLSHNPLKQRARPRALANRVCGDTHIPPGIGALENGKSDLLNRQDKRCSLP